jgi:hypothetical protein
MLLVAALEKLDQQLPDLLIRRVLRPYVVPILE